MDLTILEIHLDGAQFGPERIGDDGTDRSAETRVEAGPEREDASGTDSGGLSRALLLAVPVFVALGVAAGYALSRRLTEEPMDDAETVEIEA